MVAATDRDAWSGHAQATLQAAGYRTGRAQTAVVELLGGQTCCLTAQAIHDALRAANEPVGLASVYRTIDRLMSLGLVQRVDVGGFTSRYEPVLPGGEHHHHLVCDECGRVEAFSDAALERALAGVGRRVGYDVEGHEVVLHGACAACSH